GFCYIAGHGVPAAADAAILAATRAFFALPERHKRSLSIANSPHCRGYTVLGAEITKRARDWREAFDAGPEEPAALVAPGDPAWLRLRGPNQWPPSLPGMQAAVLDWMRAMDRLGVAVLRALALGLGQPLEHFDSAVLPRGDPHLKLSRYPPQYTTAGSDQGVGWHHDSGLVSFVLQDDVGGLQVDAGGTLVDATPKPGTYVMNLGEMLQAATSGYLRATRHRVCSPPGRDARVSVAYFFHPRLDCVFDPVTLPPELAAAARGGDNADPHDPVFRVFGENYLKIRLRSHPDVAAAHYGDVLRPIEPAHARRIDG
ncbi:MAG TPA: 2-oxoglutarate and iron-dependent oxygenase domain-containing protein, partial [Gammaproteobacteria bacterium]|nr:2-oxoglutarate and iron-dependent oxygenase domain-containing protein [Gammaproteobacteria bacterium]